MKREGSDRKVQFLKVFKESGANVWKKRGRWGKIINKYTESARERAPEKEKRSGRGQSRYESLFIQKVMTMRGETEGGSGGVLKQIIMEPQDQVRANGKESYPFEADTGDSFKRKL